MLKSIFAYIFRNYENYINGIAKERLYIAMTEAKLKDTALSYRHALEEFRSSLRKPKIEEQIIFNQVHEADIFSFLDLEYKRHNEQEKNIYYLKFWAQVLILFSILYTPVYRYIHRKHKS